MRSECRYETCKWKCIFQRFCSFTACREERGFITESKKAISMIHLKCIPKSYLPLSCAKNLNYPLRFKGKIQLEKKKYYSKLAFSDVSFSSNKRENVEICGQHSFYSFTTVPCGSNIQEPLILF